MTVFILRDEDGEILKITNTYETLIRHVCKTFLNLTPELLEIIIKLLIHDGIERFETWWEALKPVSKNQEMFFIEIFDVEIKNT